jgi:serine/threonine protein kinase
VIIVLDIARGMNYLHGNKITLIIYHDLKPPNIFIAFFETKDRGDRYIIDKFLQKVEI